MSAQANIPAGIGASIRIRRRALGLSQQDVADLCGVQRQTIGRLEADDRSVSLGIATTVADAVGLVLVTTPRTPGAH
ncbi:MAG: helix-turn-helix domain-containing protein [Actinomycetota bacterium]